MPNLYIIAGPNGAGKTTWAETFLPDYAECVDFINADLIAKGLSPFAPENAAFKAGRLLIEQIKEKSGQGIDFAFETTLSGKGHALLIKELKQKGYTINMFYLWIPDVKLAMARIEERVRHGGHNIPKKASLRRYGKSLHNLFNVYMPIMDYLEILDNTQKNSKIIAVKSEKQILINNKMLYAELEAEYGKR